ncbi:methylmalonyl-CoA mutase family protein [Leekyejoonella antrihumi]|uniref:Methylmalonyl-CoA mutase alpha/beta chain catalytic domain-containing protein n=1 Tax=Leekyejoonella antrihumi TaxID=1660198 RepID=A0A563E957_9MICO|nr:methylmalonyl-CoA mutase family protein [Leekyejoonella antrihumi]TWP38859.1 hypothetical protein FGL98_00140 [Leekyejoonella antrihumi]
MAGRGEESGASGACRRRGNRRATSGPTQRVILRPPRFRPGDAEAWLGGERSLIAADRWDPPTATRARIEHPLTFADFSRPWLADRPPKPRTREGYAHLLGRYLLPAFGETTLTGVTHGIVRKWCVTCQREPYEPLRVDPTIEANQCERLAVPRKERDNDAAARALDGLRAAAKGTDNVLLPMCEALAARATGGEVSNALRDIWGTYVPYDVF